MVSLTFVDVTKRFAGRTVIGHLSAELTGGTVTAVTGANGSGKSTLLKMAAKLLLPDEGKIVARDGRQELSKAAYRARIGIVTPEFHAYPKLTARENSISSWASAARYRSHLCSTSGCSRAWASPRIRWPASLSSLSRRA